MLHTEFQVTNYSSSHLLVELGGCRPCLICSCVNIACLLYAAMASIFTYDPDPPRVASPWTEQESHLDIAKSSLPTNLPADIIATNESGTSNPDSSGLSHDLQVTRLAAEPEFGPTEYKLHLLLRPRRSFVATSTTKHVPGSHQYHAAALGSRSVFQSAPTASPPLSQSSGSRQHRLEQLTTQLLWRLQQSSPFHASSAGSLILPSLPEATTELRCPQAPAELLPGLEESKGALYEIGISDDGTFIGLLKDEMDESLNNLRAMAASLGATVEVLRMNVIGQGEWLEESAPTKSGNTIHRTGPLYVAEAYIKPTMRQSSASTQKLSAFSASGMDSKEPLENNTSVTPTKAADEQIRVSLTGATMCGKSSLLGTLSTSTLDNGRGKSRLSLLKHRHEIASGMTSSVAQELIGYKSSPMVSSDENSVTVINYASDDVSSWYDVHAASKNGRLAFLSDSAGHPRFRRTTVRGLVGWAPHWTLLCVAASESNEMPGFSSSEASGGDGNTFAGASAHLSMAHLDLCLRLQLPLVVIMTKLDTASKSTFRQMLSTILSSLKAAGRKPLIAASDGIPAAEDELQRVSGTDVAEVQRIVIAMHGKAHAHVPIFFTSAVRGTGIGMVHALLRYLPITHVHDEKDNDGSDFYEAKEHRPTTLFHVDDVYDLNTARTPGLAGNTNAHAKDFIMSGHLARGHLSVGDELMLGPSPSNTSNVAADVAASTPANNPDGPFLTPRSFSDALAKATSPSGMRLATPEHEWQRVKVVSLRNLRLPVHTLEADRVGTVGAVLVDDDVSDAQPLIRRGMVLVDRAVRSAHTITVSFDIEDASNMVVGSRVVIYCASIRSSAKTVAVALNKDDEQASSAGAHAASYDDLAFSMESEDEEQTSTKMQSILVTLQLDSYREYIEIGAQVLLMPGGGPGLHSGDRGTRGLAGLEGFVGTAVEIFG